MSQTDIRLIAEICALARPALDIYKWQLEDYGSWTSQRTMQVDRPPKPYLPETLESEIELAEQCRQAIHAASMAGYRGSFLSHDQARMIRTALGCYRQNVSLRLNALSRDPRETPEGLRAFEDTIADIDHELATTFSAYPALPMAERIEKRAPSLPLVRTGQ